MNTSKHNDKTAGGAPEATELDGMRARLNRAIEERDDALRSAEESYKDFCAYKVALRIRLDELLAAAKDGMEAMRSLNWDLASTTQLHLQTSLRGKYERAMTAIAKAEKNQ
jgi:hypothetical protein